jgi:spore maturation protein CgeB
MNGTRHPSVLLVANGAPGQIGGFFARALADLGCDFRFVDEDKAFAPPGRTLARRAFDRACLRPGEIRRFNHAIVATAFAFRPAVVLVVYGRHVSVEALHQVREQTSALLCAYATDNPLVPGASRDAVRRAIPVYDIYASPRRASLEELRGHGCRHPVHVRFGYDPAVHFAESPPEAERSAWACDVAFVGGADGERVAFFAPLAAAPGVTLRLYGRGWRETRLASHARGEVLDREFRIALGGAAVAPCLVRRSNGDGHVMRSFEIPACRRFMLAERTDEHQELFDEDVHAAYFSTPGELADKTIFYLKHEPARARMASACHTLVARGAHTYRDRLLEILACVKAVS